MRSRARVATLAPVRVQEVCDLLAIDVVKHAEKTGQPISMSMVQRSLE